MDVSEACDRLNIENEIILKELNVLLEVIDGTGKLILLRYYNLLNNPM